MTIREYPIRTFLKNCIIIHDEFVPSIIFRLCAVLLQKPVYSKPWRSENKKIMSDISMWHPDRIEAVYQYIYKFFKHPVKWGSTKEKILYGAAHIALVLRLTVFIDHAIVLAAFYRCSGSFISLLYLKRMPNDLLAGITNKWLAHLADDRHNRELADRHIAALTYLIENVHRYESDWFYSSEPRRRIKVLRSNGTQHELKSIYMIGR